MDEKLLKDLRKTFTKKPTHELQEIINGAESGDWTVEAIIAARESIENRPDKEHPSEHGVGNEEGLPPPIMAMTPERLALHRQSLRMAGGIYILLAVVPLGAAVYLVATGAVSRGYVSFFGLALCISLLLFFCGKVMRRPTLMGHSYAIGVSGLALLFFPLGTALGAFSLWHLSKGKDVFYKPNPKSNT